LHDLGTCLRVEVAGGFVSQDDVGTVGQGPRDGHALLLTAREFQGLVVEAMAETHPFEDRV